ncbi:hypothetical protein B0H14DRAFT_3611134 [Mycena olivaceomarginata]|nr:hypothetical protein B0H14DRAFT_3611134 [Mycena olivaceomarginata]
MRYCCEATGNPSSAHTNHIDLALGDSARLTRLQSVELHIIILQTPWLRYHSALTPVPVSAPENSLMLSYLPAYLARLRASTPRVERVALYLPEGRGLMPPSPSSPERELGGEGENEGRDDTGPLLPALASFPALRAVHVRVVPDYVLKLGVAGCSTRGWNNARRDVDTAEADAEAGAERQEAWRTELHARNLDELRVSGADGGGDAAVAGDGCVAAEGARARAVLLWLP